MRYWWVNHKQTFKQEITGYIWSPKIDKNGARNQAYINLTLAKKGDTIFSYANKFVRAVGRVSNEYKNHLRPNEFGDIGDQWDRDGWLVRVNWTLLENPLSPTAHLSKLVPLLPKKYSPIRADGKEIRSYILLRSVRRSAVCYSH